MVKQVQPLSTVNSSSALTTTGLPPALAQRMAQDAGKGTSTAQEDNIVPLIYILQAQSPQVNPRKPEHLEGAQPGDIWLRNSTSPVIKGNDGIVFQPCHFFKDWVEWVPRDSGGGFVGRHADLPPDAKKQEDPRQPARVRYVRSNGNELVETRYHVGLAWPSGQPFVIPFTSSGHTVSRQWMFSMNSKTLPGTSSRPPTWACLYRLRTKERSNAAGTWFTFDVSDEGWVQTEEQYARGAALHESFISGEKATEAPEATGPIDPEVM